MIDEIDLAKLIADQSDWLRTCQKLEAAADRLPQWPSLPEIAELRTRLEQLTENAGEIDRLLQTTMGDGHDHTLSHSLGRRLHERRTAATLLAQDLVDLLSLDPQPQSAGSDALGFMLRCLFEGARDTILLERLALLTLAGNRLTPEVRSLVSERLIESCAA